MENKKDNNYEDWEISDLVGAICEEANIQTIINKIEGYFYTHDEFKGFLVDVLNSSNS